MLSNVKMLYSKLSGYKSDIIRWWNRNLMREHKTFHNLSNNCQSLDLQLYWKISWKYPRETMHIVVHWYQYYSIVIIHTEKFVGGLGVKVMLQNIEIEHK